MCLEIGLDKVSALIDGDAATAATCKEQLTPLAPPRRRYPRESDR